MKPNPNEGIVPALDDGKKKEPAYKPPQTFEEFLKAENLEEWPYRITLENLLDLEDERQLLGTEEDIAAELKQATPLDMKPLADLEARLTSFQERLHKYGSIMVKFPESEGQPLPPPRKQYVRSISRAFLTEIDNNIAKTQPKASRQVSKPGFAEQIQETRKRTVEFCTFPGFRSGELCELPGQLEAPQILNRVTKIQDFNPGFKKFWKKIFQSEASIAMLKDVFWWIFINFFEPDRSEDQSRLFDRIADSFVALFFSVNPEIKDKVFEVYADCLSQAIFVAFMESFPESERRFHDEFKQAIVNIISEWISGVRPVQGGWNRWDLKRLEMRHNSNSSKKSGASKSAVALKNDVKHSIDFDDFHRVVNRLGEEDRVGNMTNTLKALNMVKAFNLPSREGTKLTLQSSGAGKMSVPAVPPISPSRDPVGSTPKKEQVQSHQVGPGPEMQRILFNLQGRSPLVAHYLYMRQLKDSEDRGIRVRRTQVLKEPPKAPTYKQVIDETRARQGALSKEYQKICEITNQEILKIEKEQRDTKRRIEALQKELLFCKNSLEVKFMSDDIFNRKDSEAPNKSATRRGASRNHQKLDIESDSSD